jgi:hypothetical protein
MLCVPCFCDTDLCQGAAFLASLYSNQTDGSEGVAPLYSKTEELKDYEQA